MVLKANDRRTSCPCHDEFSGLDLTTADRLFETLNKETATNIGIRQAEDWFRPIDLAKECDIYISSRNGSPKETPIAGGYTEVPFKNRSRNYKPKSRDS
ncbi:hypothetical protein TNCV_5137891 [Trichonephila clavipes]|nr:hypothetical protein TNCV_5137891 [Trichonephila clavipes]